MTLNSIMNVGVSGLLAQSNKINTISNNIANVNTVGFKGFRSDFANIVQSSANNIYESFGGANTGNQQLNSKQGEFSPTNKTTDIAINGDGFFVVTADKTSNDIQYTRAGAFLPDKNGDLRNSSGFYLHGWALDSTGNLPAALQSNSYGSGEAISNLKLVNISAVDSISVPTSAISIRANLNSNSSVYNPVGNISFTNNPTAGDTITINGVTWTFVASGATGNQTNIDTNLGRTLTQLAKDINASSNPALTPAKYANIGDTQLGITYDTLKGGAASTFTIASSSSNAVASQLLIYNPALPASNMTSGAINSSFNRSTDIIDNNGVSHKININFLKTGIDSVNKTSTWAVELSSSPTTDSTRLSGQIAAGNMVFNGDGSLSSISQSLTDPISFAWTSTGTTPTGATTPTTNNTVSFNWGTAGAAFGTPNATTIGKTDGMRQLSEISKVDELTQDGHGAGSLKNIEISDSGVVTANYNNGAKQSLFVVPLAKFVNPDGLNNISGTAYKNSATSGFINIFAAGKEGAGKIVSGSLENSTVDLSTQYTDIIVAQRAYQASSKTISTSDDMLKTITDMLK